MDNHSMDTYGQVKLLSNKNALKLLRFLKTAGLSVRTSLFLCSFHMLIWNFRVSFCTYEGTVPYRSSAQMPCRLLIKDENN
jgi:hypothetical protein